MSAGTLMGVRVTYSIHRMPVDGAWKGGEDDERVQPALEVDHHQQIDEQHGKAEACHKAGERAVHRLGLAAEDDAAAAGQFGLDRIDDVAHIGCDRREVAAEDVGVHVEDGLDVVVTDVGSGEPATEFGEIAEQLRLTRDHPGQGIGAAVLL